MCAKRTLNARSEWPKPQVSHEREKGSKREAAMAMKKEGR